MLGDDSIIAQPFAQRREVIGESLHSLGVGLGVGGIEFGSGRIDLAQLDSNILGIPKEGYGFSNNPNVMRKPYFDETKFELTAADKAIEIEIL